MSASDVFLQVAHLLRRVWIFEQWFPAAVILGVVLVAAAWISKRLWVQLLVGAAFLVASATYSVWLIAVGGLLAVLGVSMALAGAVWMWAARRRLRRGHASGALVWPGLGLVAAPLVNIYVVMPIIRHFVK
jgi:hypothetical protein